MFKDGNVELYARCNTRGDITSFVPIKGSAENVRKTIQMIVNAIHISITVQDRKFKSFLIWLAEAASQEMQS